MTDLVISYLAERPDYIHALHVDDCPIPAREWEGKPYANVVADCFDCPYNKGVVKDDTVEAEENEAGGAHRWEDLSHLLGRTGWKPQPHARSATQFNCNTTSMLAKLTFYASCQGFGTRAMIIQIV